MAEVDPCALLSWLEERTDAMCDFLARVAMAESPTVEPGSQAAVFALLAAELEAAGFAVRRIRGSSVGDHLFARPQQRRAGAPYQLLVGHMDTVWPLGTLAEMPVLVEGDRLYGPGVFDMKGGLVQMVFALKALTELDLAPDVRPAVLVAADEETGSRDSRRYVELLARSAARAFVLEPSFGPAGKLKTARKGAGHFVVTARGKAAHAGVSPEQGLSAILEISHQVQRLFAMNDPARGITVNVGTIDGGLRANVVAPVATADVDARVPTVEAAREIDGAIRGLRPVHEGISLTVEGGFGRPPMEPTSRNRLLWRAAETAAARLGISLDEVAVGGASDGNYTSLHTATLDGLGAVGDGAHAPDEHVLIPRLPERAALLALLLLEPEEP